MADTEFCNFLGGCGRQHHTIWGVAGVSSGRGLGPHMANEVVTQLHILVHEAKESAKKSMLEQELGVVLFATHNIDTRCYPTLIVMFFGFTFFE